MKPRSIIVNKYFYTITLNNVKLCMTRIVVFQARFVQCNPHLQKVKGKLKSLKSRLFKSRREDELLFPPPCLPTKGRCQNASDVPGFYSQGHDYLV